MISNPNYSVLILAAGIGKRLSSVGKKDRNFFHIATKGGIKTTPGGPPKFDNSKDYLSTKLEAFE